jgi:hypothetical protein
MKANNPQAWHDLRGNPGEWSDTHANPATGFPELPSGLLGAGGIPVPVPLLPVPAADHAQQLIAATLAGETLPGTTPADAQALYRSHAPNWAGVDPGFPLDNDPYSPAIPQQASDITGTSRPDRNH